MLHKVTVLGAVSDCSAADTSDINTYFDCFPSNHSVHIRVEYHMIFSSAMNIMGDDFYFD